MSDECPDCDGKGVAGVVEHATAVCCMNATDSGDCCGNPVPEWEKEVVPCPTCEPVSDEKLTAASTECPHCEAVLIAGKIPEKHQQAYGGREYFSRTISIYSQEKDRTVAYRCPDCGAEDERKWT
jgi:hypothetical protein